MSGEKKVEESQEVVSGSKSDTSPKLPEEDMDPGKDGVPSFESSAENSTSGSIEGYNGSVPQLDDQAYYSAGAGSYTGVQSDNSSVPYYMPDYNPYATCYVGADGEPLSYGSEPLTCYSWDSTHAGDVVTENAANTENVKSAVSQKGSLKSDGCNSSKTNSTPASKSTSLPLNSKARQFNSSSNSSKCAYPAQTREPLNKASSAYQSTCLPKSYYHSSYASQVYGASFLHHPTMNYQTNGREWNANNTYKSKGNFSRNNEFEANNTYTSKGNFSRNNEFEANNTYTSKGNFSRNNEFEANNTYMSKGNLSRNNEFEANNTYMSKGNLNRNSEFEASAELVRGPRANKINCPRLSEHPAPTFQKEKYNLEDFSTEYESGKFFVIKSYSEDDVHKCVKYDVWASTANGNKKLDSAFCDAEAKARESRTKCPVFLFFSVNKSGQFLGVAEMIGPVDFNTKMDFWQLDKWTGFLPVKWHIVKDVPHNQLRHITLENNDHRPVTYTRDTQEIPLKQGLEMLSIFKKYKESTSILDDYNFYEDRNKSLKARRNNQPPSQSYDETNCYIAGGNPTVKTNYSDPVSLTNLTKNLSLNR